MNARLQLPLPTAREERARRLLAGVEKNYSPAAFASDFGAADMVVLDLIARDGLAIPVFTVDTGLLAVETHALIARVRKHYGVEIAVYKPWPETVDAFVEQHGAGGDHADPAARDACHAVRRAEPLSRALARKRGWISAQRREAATGAPQVAETVLDPVHGIWKFSPLADWSTEEVRRYLYDNAVPHNFMREPDVLTACHG